jgi:GT2 family glycosyltransferase
VAWRVELYPTLAKALPGVRHDRGAYHDDPAGEQTRADVRKRRLRMRRMFEGVIAKNRIEPAVDVFENASNDSKPKLFFCLGHVRIDAGEIAKPEPPKPAKKRSTAAADVEHREIRSDSDPTGQGDNVPRTGEKGHRPFHAIDDRPNQADETFAARLTGGGGGKCVVVFRIERRKIRSVLEPKRTAMRALAVVKATTHAVHPLGSDEAGAAGRVGRAKRARDGGHDLPRGEGSSLRRFSIIIVNTNEAPVLFECLECISRGGRPFETVVVDNASTDGSPERVESQFPWAKLVRAGANLGYAGANNLGARGASGDILVFLNPDAFVEPGWLEAVDSAFDDAAVGVVGPRIYRGRKGAEGIIDSAGGDIEFPLGDAPGRGYLQKSNGRFQKREDVAYVSGAALAVRAALFDRVGRFDEEFFCYYEETDLCWRIRMLGLRCVYEPNATVYHLGSFTFGNASARKVYLQTRNRIRSCLQNLDWTHALQFLAAEAVVGSSIIVGSAAIVKYRDFAGAYARAWLDVFLGVPAVLRKRAVRQRARVVSDQAVLASHRSVSVAAAIRRYTRFARQGGDALFAEGIGAAAATE